MSWGATQKFTYEPIRDPAVRHWQVKEEITLPGKQDFLLILLLGSHNRETTNNMVRGQWSQNKYFRDTARRINDKLI